MNPHRPVLTAFLFPLVFACSASAAGTETNTPRPGTSARTAASLDATRMMSQPDVSGERICFVYANDIWVGKTDGTDIRRLTTHPGREFAPRFSPDGETVAFTGQYDGNFDVYVVSVNGGAPKRLTWHPGLDMVQGFTPTGSAVLFTSARAVHTRRYNQLFTVALDASQPEALPIPTAWKASYSPDGSQIAYTPLREPFREWKHYRGGAHTRIWIFDVADHSIEEVPQGAERCNDTDPVWVGSSLYFLSDRNGEFNLFSFRPGESEPRRRTEYADFPILSLQTDGKRLIFEQAATLHLFHPGTSSPQDLALHVPAELSETRPRFVVGTKYVRSAALSPSGKRAVFGIRGEIVTVPAEKGTPRNLTRTPGTHERTPAWSPDGRSIAYFSDAGGEYQLVIAPASGKGEAKSFPLSGSGFYEHISWSPDSKKLCYWDNSWALFLFDVESGQALEVDRAPIYSALDRRGQAWSPDSKWLTYTLDNDVYYRSLKIYDIEKAAVHTVTGGLGDIGEPVFDSSGGLLYFTASTDVGGANTWFAMSNADMTVTNSLYVAVLSSEAATPFGPESDEEVVADEEQGSASAIEGDEEPSESSEEKENVTSIDFAGLHQRILPLPLSPAYYHGLRAGADGKLFYIESERGSPFGSAPGQLTVFDPDSRKETDLGAGVSGFTLSADGKKALVVQGGSWHLCDAGSPVDPKTLNLDAVLLHVDPRAEWKEMFEEAWRINRDYFYDPNMHGADWPALREKYARFLPDLAARSDLNRLIQWMCSELSVGHHRVGGGDFLYRAETVPGGLLGADFEVADGRYRFRRVFEGQSWSPNLRAPLSEPGRNVKQGEFLLAVNGTPLLAPANLFAPFEHTAGEVVELTVGPNPDGTDSREISVVPIGNETGLRHQAWIEGNIEKVTEATDGRVAYVYVPDTADGGHESFKRYFFPQANRQAVIVDERYNSGGLLADYVIDHLRRPHVADWAMRYGRDLDTPQASIEGPKVMLIDENAGSGGDLLPWMFRKLGIGTLIGRPTWGGLVGILGFPTLMDGGSITAPNLGIWTEDGFVVENVGVPPDIEVEQTPAEVIAGHDPQLERAIEVVLQQLAENPPPLRTRPPFPIRAK